MLHNSFILLLSWELKNILGRISNVLTVVMFFVITVLLFPFAIGIDQELLHVSAAGIIWVCALLAMQLSHFELMDKDYRDGSLEQYILHGVVAELIILVKVLGHWLSTGLLLVVTVPLVGVMLGLASDAIISLIYSLLMGTPLLSMLSGFGAALTLGAKRSSVLVPLLMLPLSIPVLIFCTAFAVAEQGEGITMIIIAIELLVIPILLFAGGSALRYAIRFK